MDKQQYEIMYDLEDQFWWYVGMRRITQALLPAAESNRELRILDAGCGTGANLEFFASWGKVTGIDIADEALSFCQERGHDCLSRCSIEHLPFPDDTFDLVSSFDVIYHLAVGDDVAALREFHRVLRPGGMVLLRAPAYDWLRGVHDHGVHTRHRYTRGELRDKLGTAGFTGIRTTHANFFLFPVAVVKRVFEGIGLVVAEDMEQPLPIVNRSFSALLSFEARMVKHVDLPWGLSVFGLGVK